MTLCTDDGQTTCLTHFWRQLDIRTTTSHVGSDGHSTQHAFFLMHVAVRTFYHDSAQSALSCQCHHFGLALVQLSIQHIVRYLAHVEHTAQGLRDFHRGSTHQAGASAVAHLLYLGYHGLVFLTLRLIDAVVHIVTDDRAVGRNHHYIQLVDVPELTSLCFCCTRHTSQLVVHTEVVLQGDGGKSLCGSFYLDALLRLYSLMQTVAPATTLHDTASLLIDDLHLVVHHHIVHILGKHGVGLEQLQQGVYALRLDGVVCQHLVFLLQALLICEVCACLQLRQLCGDVWQHEEGRIGGVAADFVETLVCEVHTLQLLIDDEVQWFCYLVHATVVLLHIDFLGLEHAGLDALLAEELNQWLVLRQCLVAAIEGEKTCLHLFLVV